MERKEFLRGIGLAGMASMIPFKRVLAGNGGDTAAKPTSCVLIPSETEGPFPLDLTENSTFFRSDVRDDRTGVTLNLKLKIIGEDNCEPMANVRVNIWACDKDGIYSGYNNAMNPGDVDATYQRGWQMTDAYGEVDFTAIFPGWYNGRICHIHFQVYVSSIYRAVSQLTFPIDTKNALYAANSSFYTKGDDPMSLEEDNIFNDGYSYQMATLTENTDGSYDAYLEVTVQGSGVTSLANYEGETGGQFKLGQNYPNPYSDNTRIPFTLAYDASVKVELFDIAAKKVGEVDAGNLGAGSHEIVLNLSGMNIARGNYIYQLQVSNSKGVFRQCKMMTAAR